jgi:hypothetical protein
MRISCRSQLILRATAQDKTSMWKKVGDASFDEHAAGVELDQAGGGAAQLIW